MPAGDWSAALDRLEQDLAAAEKLLSADPDAEHAAWEPPADLGPLPADLAPRARDLLTRQHRLLAALRAAVAGNRRQARVADTVSAATRGPERPAYLDVRA